LRQDNLKILQKSNLLQISKFSKILVENFSQTNNKAIWKNNYLCTYDLYGPMHYGFDAGRYFCGEVGGGRWHWKSIVL
jgi:hypothetical protein